MTHIVPTQIPRHRAAVQDMDKRLPLATQTTAIRRFLPPQRQIRIVWKGISLTHLLTHSLTNSLTHCSNTIIIAVYKYNTQSKNEGVVKVHNQLAQGLTTAPHNHMAPHTQKRNNKQTATTKQEELHYKNFRSVQMIREPSMALAIHCLMRLK